MVWPQNKTGDTAIKTLWVMIFSGVLLWSGIEPKDRFTWFLEVSPAVIGAILLALTWRSFRLTSLLYVLVLAHCIVLMIGGHYTYAEVPFFDAFLGAERNNYDKLGHLFQGFVPAMLVREITIRKQIINGPLWRSFFTVCVCLAFSALYELLEWWVALVTGEGADAFLGTQGYEWDTQSDMAMALLGACTALVLLSTLHNRQLARLGYSADDHS